MELCGEVGENATDICRLFSIKFRSVFSTEPASPERIQLAANNVPTFGSTISEIDVSNADINAAVCKLKHSSSPGPDGIPATLLKKCISGLHNPLLHLFRLSLAKGKFPEIWKSSYLFPVHKKGDRKNIDNYRGISALCAASKLFELVVMEPVFSYCKTYIANEQHGFMPKRSTATNLLSFTTFVMDSLIRRSQTDAVYTDLTAAFDKIDHNITVAKLSKLGFNGNLLRWFRSYLTRRSTRVSIGGILSNVIHATSGIPQGSHLGPLIFLIYFNDINNSLVVPRLAYADDLKVFSAIDKIEDAHLLQQQLDKLADWCLLNGMILNPKKCLIVTYTRKARPFLFDYRLFGVSIPRDDHIKDLGVILDSQLNYKQHISYIVDKASRQLGLIFRMTKSFRNVQCLSALYCSLVRSSLEYCSTVWNPVYNNAVTRLESVQRRFVRFALRLLPWRSPMHLTPYEHRRRLLHLDSLQLRRDVARALVVSDALTSRIDCPEILRRINIHAPSRQLRNSMFLYIPVRPSNYSKNGAIIGIQRAFNKVSSVFDFHLSRDVIRIKFFSYLRQHH